VTDSRCPRQNGAYLEHRKARDPTPRLSKQPGLGVDTQVCISSLLLGPNAYSPAICGGHLSQYATYLCYSHSTMKMGRTTAAFRRVDGRFFALVIVREGWGSRSVRDASLE